jgi:hypothetical protein
MREAGSGSGWFWLAPKPAILTSHPTPPKSPGDTGSWWLVVGGWKKIIDMHINMQILLTNDQLPTTKRFGNPGDDSCKTGALFAGILVPHEGDYSSLQAIGEVSGEMREVGSKM